MRIEDKKELNKIKEELENIKKYKVLCKNYNESIKQKRKYFNEEVIEYMDGKHIESDKVKTTFNITAPQETEVIKKEAAIEKVEKEIKALESKRNFYFTKLYIANKGLEFIETIDPEVEYIIYNKYINKKSWQDVEISFNDKFRTDNDKYIGEKMLYNKSLSGIIDFKEFIDSYPKNLINFEETLLKLNFKL